MGLSKEATGMIAKTRHYIRDSKCQLLSIYHSIFASHMTYGCQVWGLCQNKYTKKIQTLQNRAVRLISFAYESPVHIHTVDLYKQQKLLKFSDLVTLKNLLFVHDYLNKSVPDCFDGYFILEKDLYHQNTRNAVNSKLFKPYRDSTKYGLKSFKLTTISSWNELCDAHPNCNFPTLSKSKFKNLVINHFLESYTHNSLEFV